MTNANIDVFEKDVTVPTDEVSDEELALLLDFHYQEEDWNRSTGPCQSFYQLRNDFVSGEAAKLQINRILTALRKIRGGSLERSK